MLARARCYGAEKYLKSGMGSGMSVPCQHPRFDPHLTLKPMAGWVLVKEAGWKQQTGLAKWMEIGKKFALSLPEKRGKTKAKKTKTLREYQH